MICLGKGNDDGIRQTRAGCFSGGRDGVWWNGHDEYCFEWTDEDGNVISDEQELVYIVDGTFRSYYVSISFDDTSGSLWGYFNIHSNIEDVINDSSYK